MADTDIVAVRGIVGDAMNFIDALIDKQAGRRRTHPKAEDYALPADVERAARDLLTVCREAIR